MSENNERYLGDGLYASFDGFQFVLRAPREDGDHFVALEPAVLHMFFRYVADINVEVNAGFWMTPPDQESGE